MLRRNRSQNPSPRENKSGSSPDIYTDPQLRDRLKDEVTAGDKGGKPGQWSARKAQLLASEYEKAGGDYKNGKRRRPRRSSISTRWTKEDWKTSDDKPAERDGGTTRYLPAEAWDQLTPAQQKATNAKKQAGSKQGEQFVANTDDAKDARNGPEATGATRRRLETEAQGAQSQAGGSGKPRQAQAEEPQEVVRRRIT